jgi:hypothetical protein
MDDEGGVDSREAARTRRRDRDASAAERDLMRPGMGKVFRQILDRQGRDAREAREPTDPATERETRRPDERRKGR